MLGCNFTDAGIVSRISPPRGRCWQKELHSCKYEGCCESNASCFVVLAHSARGECWWSSSRGWTFPPLSTMCCCCVTDGSRGVLTQWHVTWKCTGSNSRSLNSSTWKKWHPLAFIDICRTLVETKPWMWAQWGNEWCVSAAGTAMWDKPHSKLPCWYRRAQHVDSCSSQAKMHS